MAEAVPPSTLKLRVTSPARALRLRAALLVIRSPLVPVSLLKATVGWAMVVSSVKLNDVVGLALAKPSICLTWTTLLPSTAVKLLLQAVPPLMLY